MLAVKPLLAWTIEEAHKSKFVDMCIVSTEDEEIKDVAERWGGNVPFLRLAKLAQDDTPGIDPVIHAIRLLLEYDFVVLLQAPSPLRTVENIDEAIAYCLGKGYASCVSMTESEHSPIGCTIWMRKIDCG